MIMITSPMMSRQVNILRLTLTLFFCLRSDGKLPVRLYMTDYHKVGLVKKVAETRVSVIQIQFLCIKLLFLLSSFD